MILSILPDKRDFKSAEVFTAALTKTAGSCYNIQNTAKIMQEGEVMNMQEMSRLILGLRKLGLSDKELTDFLLWVENGEKQYEPRPLNEQKKT